MQEFEFNGSVMKSIIFLFVYVFLLSGCVVTQKVLDPVDPESVLSPKQLQNELHLHEQRLTQTITGICQKHQKHQEYQVHQMHQEHLMRMDANLISLLAQVEKINDRDKQRSRTAVKVEKAQRPQAPSLTEGKLLLGERELVYLDEFEHVFTAHIDLAADSSMLKADNISVFERDGSQWVRFDLSLHGDDKSKNNGKPKNKALKTFETKVQRMVRIKSRSNGQKAMRYPVIRVHLSIGKYQGVTDIYLGGKNKRKHTLVLGRKFIKDIAVIDISQTFVQGKTYLHKPK